MSAPGSPAAMKARRYLDEIELELLRLLENAPAFGSASIGMTFHNSEITSIDLAASVKRHLQGGSR
jgi:hypothetical protein